MRLFSGWVAFDDVAVTLVGGGGTNLVVNPGFESSGNWNEIRYGEFPGTSFWRATGETAAPHSGSYAYVLSNHVYGYLKSNAIVVSAGTQYDLYAWVRGEIDADDSHRNWIVRAVFYDSGGTQISYVNTGVGGGGKLNLGKPFMELWCDRHYATSNRRRVMRSMRMRKFVSYTSITMRR